MNCCYSFSIKT